MPKNSDVFFFANIIGNLTLQAITLLLLIFHVIPASAASLIPVLINAWMVGNLCVGLWYYRLGPFRPKE